MPFFYVSLILLALPASATVGQHTPGVPFSWDNAIVYAVVTDRFANGDPANDHAYGRGLDGHGVPYDDGAGHFYGGDWAGLTRKVEDGYFSDLGVNVLRVTAPYEQVHGWIAAGNGTVQEYAYHGRWALDYTGVDAGLGTEEALARFVDAAHTQGLRVVFDVVLNHAGPPTLLDMSTYGFGAVTSDDWRGWRPAAGETWADYRTHFVAPVEEEAWRRWWGPAWIRADLPGYTPCGAEPLTECLHGLPDFKTDSVEPVDLPPLLTVKWDSVKLAHEQEALHAFFERTGRAPTPTAHLIKWLSDWVRTYGIDGFYLDAAPHVAPAVSEALKKEATAALAAWKAAHPNKKRDDLPFWMAGGAPGHGVERSALFTYGFDAVLNTTFQVQAAHLTDPDSLFSDYAATLGSGPEFHVISYVSSAGTHLFERSDLIRAGTLLLLAPGGVAVFYGDETARPEGPALGDTTLQTYSPMNWDAIDQAVLAHWRTLGVFRSRHPALAAGSHERLLEEPYTFHRSYRRGGLQDDVVAVLGASGRTQINVSRVFPDNTWLRDAYTGKTAIVSYGLVTFDAAPEGVILIEEVE